ncbi:MAG: carboxypeptidase-like regulatory domain-containing protein [Balneolaceae bacterium]|nr:MAG: carboxypeptidase-like regulatory domain-containing protein [Balneolaceae bacterium]
MVSEWVGGFMRSLCISTFISFSLLAICFSQTCAQYLTPATIQGRVVDYHTGEPLQYAHVFLSGTRIGTVTNPAGRFQIEHIPPGSYRLVVSIIGYERAPVDILLREADERTYVRRLKPVIYQMNELYVGNLDNRWERYLNRFERLFIGETALADDVAILNPEVLRFNSRWWGRLEAEAMAPLIIENRSLGYRITYHLEEFRHSGTRTRWTGESHFEDMTPVNAEQAEVWEKNREEAFEGSLRHFLLSLSQLQLRQNGFLMYEQRRDMHGNYHRNSFRLNPARIVSRLENDHFYHLNFNDRIEIVYACQSEDPRYPRWFNQQNRAPARVQTSYLQLNRRPVTVDPNGEIVETYGATRFGYHSFQRVADKTPKDYRPENYHPATFRVENCRALQ